MSHPIPSNLPTVITSIEPYVAQYGYVGVASLILLESLGLPVPGETTLIAAAIFAGIGQLNIFVILVLAIVMAVIGDNIGFAIGHFAGEPLIIKYGKYVGVNEANLKKLKAFFKRRGPIVVVVARFIDGLRQLNGIIAGLSFMKWKTFLGFNFLGAVIWVSFWTSIGYYGGSHIHTLLKYELYFSVLIGLIVVGLIFRFLLKSIKKSKKLG